MKSAFWRFLVCTLSLCRWLTKRMHKQWHGNFFFSLYSHRLQENCHIRVAWSWIVSCAFEFSVDLKQVVTQSIHRVTLFSQSDSECSARSDIDLASEQTICLCTGEFGLLVVDWLRPWARGLSGFRFFFCRFVSSYFTGRTSHRVSCCNLYVRCWHAFADYCCVKTNDFLWITKLSVALTAYSSDDNEQSNVRLLSTYTFILFAVSWISWILMSQATMRSRSQRVNDISHMCCFLWCRFFLFFSSISLLTSGLNFRFFFLVTCVRVCFEIQCCLLIYGWT